MRYVEAFSLYSSLFYSSSLASKHFLSPAFLEYKINYFLNRYQRSAPVPKRFSFSPCLFCNWYCTHVTEHVASIDTREWQVIFHSHLLINSVKPFIRCVARQCKIQNFSYQQRGKNEKEKLFPNFRQLLGLFLRGQSDLLHQTDSCCRLSFFVFFFSRCCLEEILIFVIL